MKNPPGVFHEAKPLPAVSNRFEDNGPSFDQHALGFLQAEQPGNSYIDTDCYRYYQHQFRTERHESAVGNLQWQQRNHDKRRYNGKAANRNNPEYAVPESRV